MIKTFKVFCEENLVIPRYKLRDGGRQNDYKENKEAPINTNTQFGKDLQLKWNIAANCFDRTTLEKISVKIKLLMELTKNEENNRIN